MTPPPRNDGKRLERLVEMIEGMRLPKGFTIEKNAPVFNDEGQQIAELDVLISGRIGSVLHRTLFECRDRPSDGAAPVSWLEQLYGRKQRLKLNAIVAVSTTGFAPGAIGFAQQENIPLRTVETLTEDEIRGFLSRVAPLWETEGIFSRIHVVVMSENIPHATLDSPHLFVEQYSSRLDKTDKVFLDIESNKRLTANELWTCVLGRHSAEAFSDVPPNWEFVEKTIETRDDFKAKFRVVRDAERAKIQLLTFTARVRHRLTPMPLVEAVSYDGSDGPGSVVARWKGKSYDEHDVEINAILHRNEKPAQAETKPS